MPRYRTELGVEVFDSLRQVLPDNEAARTRAVELATNLGKANLADLTTKAIRVTNDEGRCFLECRSGARFKYKPYPEPPSQERNVLCHLAGLHGTTQAVLGCPPITGFGSVRRAPCEKNYANCICRTCCKN